MDSDRAKKRARMGPKDLPELDPFPNPFIVGDYDYGARKPLTLVEIEMMMLSGTIRNKPDWWEKRKDSTITSKWREEAVSQGATKDAFEYVLAELERYDSMREGKIQAASIDGVWQADNLIPQELVDSLNEGVSKLENIPDHLKDWHPGSNEQVLDLVHPSLFPYVFGTTRQTDVEARPWYKFIGGGEITSAVPPPPDVPAVKPNRWAPISKEYGTSKMYQWLPSEFAVDEEGHVVIRSYINNLHPITHRALYPTIAKIFEHFVPMFNKVLTDLLNVRPDRIKVDPYNWYTDEPEDDDERDAWWQNRQPTPPTIPTYNPPPLPTNVVDLKGRDLQVIVKLANIVLTPEKPEYSGGVWHVEGMENENIVASGIFYYDVSDDNITESQLRFRQAVCEPDYEQSDDNGVRAIFGLENEGALNQYLGAVVTQGGRCITFPNTLQHQVAPFRLVDPTKPGHRKILVFFLIDPLNRIVSTANVPPQQREWYADFLANHVLKAEGATGAVLPPELISHVVDYVDWPMSLEEAKQHREALMKERKFFIGNNNKVLFERPFSLCEH